MSQYQKVLVAVDLTDETTQLLKAAAAIAEQNQAQVCMIK